MTPILERTLKAIVRIEDREISAVLWAFASFFFLLGGYYALRPVRDAMGIAGGTSHLKWLFSATAVFMIPVTLLFGAVVSRFPRRQFIPYVFHFFTVTLIVFYLLPNVLEDRHELNLARTLYVYITIMGLFLVSVFWEFMADLFDREQGKRLFGFISAGGSLGGICGSYAPLELLDVVDVSDLLLFAAVTLEISLLCAVRLERVLAQRPDEASANRRRPEGANPRRGGAAWAAVEGLILTVRSPYLIAIALYVAFYTLGSTGLYFLKAEVAAESFATRTERTEFFATINFWVNLTSFLIQGLLTARIIRVLHLRRSLVLLPALTTVGFAALAAGLATPALPLLPIFVIFEALRRTTRFSIDKPALQVFYTVLTRREKYKAKNFIDTVHYRATDALWGWTLGTIIDRAGVAVMVMVTLLLVVLSLPLGALLGGMQARYGPKPLE